MVFSTAVGKDLFLVRFPFQDIFTSAVIVRTPQGFLVYDAATYPEDMDRILFPALYEVGVTKENLKYLAVSHAHRDHAGGLGRFLERYENVKVISSNESLREDHPGGTFVPASDGAVLLGCLKILSIPGHTADAFGILDTRSSTLLSSDCLQYYGIFGSGKWGSNISYSKAHLKALERLEKEEISTFLGAHDFHPCGQIVEGRENVTQALSHCKAALDKIRTYLGENLSQTDEDLAQGYNESHSLPTVGAHVFRKMRAEWFS